MNLDNRLAGRPVFITGADGFVGSYLIERLVEHGANVHGFVRARSSGGIRNIDHLIDEVTIHRGDLRDSCSVRESLSALQPYSDSLVFHFGAQAHVGESWRRPYETIDVNVTGTLNMLQAIVDLDLDLAKFNMAGTSEEYGNLDDSRTGRYDFDEDGRLVLDERSPVNPMSIYATSKVTADFLTMNYYDAYGVPAVTTRMFNNYGPRQDPRYITGTIITQALERNVVELGNLTSKRDFCYVSDGVRGHMYVTLDGTPGEQYVYGYGESISMRAWADLILDVGVETGYWDRPEIVQTEERFRPGDSEVEELRVEYEKFNEMTGWEPRVDWREGIHRSIEWYAGHKSRWFGSVDWR